uniref:Alkaline phosphatase n=1 Tax=Gongronella sp. TaxID=1981611 RepID=A0A7G7Y5X1_9FUNG|nr:alkaline phosphatase [Gongronella sp.]
MMQSAGRTKYNSVGTLSEQPFAFENYYLLERRKYTLHPSGRLHGWLISIVVFTMVATMLLLVAMTGDEEISAVPSVHDASVESMSTSDFPPGVILMISDGFGPASETFAHQFHNWRQGDTTKDVPLPLDDILVGHARTKSFSSLVTDSAAGATAFSCGLKTYNGAVGVDDKSQPCGTLLESAKVHRGMMTGLVVTSRITHATPASFSSHVAGRDDENAIAAQLIGDSPLGRVVDLMFGGGTCHFRPNTSSSADTPSCRSDSRDLFKEAQENHDWNVYLDRAAFDGLDANAKLPLMNLFDPSHLEYEIDRNSTTQPSLAEMAYKAVQILGTPERQAPNGYFLVIEGSRIDMAAHTNDPAAHVHDIWEYQETVKKMKEFVKTRPNTVLISISDHETGGLTLGRQVGNDYPEYKWNPSAIERVQKSAETLAAQWIHAVQQNVASESFLQKSIFKQGLGIDDATSDETAWFMEWRNDAPDSDGDVAYQLGDMVSRRALIGWTTHGHTAVDVNLYAYANEGPNIDELRGVIDNVDIAHFVSKYLNLDIQDITKRLNANKTFVDNVAANKRTHAPRGPYFH